LVEQVPDPNNPSRGADREATPEPDTPEALTPLQEARRQLRRAERLIEEGKRAKRRFARQQEEITALQTRLAKVERGDTQGGIQPENIVWIFGAGRTGSSWLAFMMEALPGHSRWNEPLVGHLFGYTYHVRAPARANDPTDRHFILGTDRPTWRNSIRSFVLEGAGARFPERADGGYLVIKEPHGSLGAPLLMEALPESRMIFLVRDPRDAVASALDAHREDSWAHRRVERQRSTPDEDPDTYVQSRSEGYLSDIQHVKQAYEAHEGRKVLVRYEDLRADTFAEMKRIYSELAIPVDEGDLAEAVGKHDWSNVPEEQKGPGKIRRKAAPGSFREDLTPEQVEVVEDVCAPILREFYER
jgi:hypothetical protein